MTANSMKIDQNSEWHRYFMFQILANPTMTNKRDNYTVEASLADSHT